MGRASWVHGQIFMGQFCGNAVRVKQNKLGVEYVSPIVCVSINRAQSCNCCLPKEEEGKEVCSHRPAWGSKEHLYR